MSLVSRLELGFMMLLGAEVSMMHLNHASGCGILKPILRSLLLLRSDLWWISLLA